MKNIEFSEKYFRIPWRGNMPNQAVELTQYQKALLVNMEQNPKVIASFSRQSGVSTCLAIHIANYMIFGSTNKIIAVISSTQSSASYLIDKIRAILEEYRNVSTNFTQELYYRSNSKQRIVLFNGNEVRVVSSPTVFVGSDDTDRVSKLVVDNSNYVKNLDKIERDFKLTTAVEQIIITNTTENMSQAMKIDQSDIKMELKKVEKPPLGLMPWGVWEYVMNLKRIEEIKDAIKRYLEANQPIPPAWITELNERNKK